MIHSARFKLTLAYTVGIALLMAAFSIALYAALQGALSGNLEAGGSADPQVEQAILGSELTRARIVLIVINLAGWLLAALVAYAVAGRTLRPIAAAVERQRQFTAHASHELRTPLTVIKGEIGVTLARPRESTEYRRILTLINEEVDQLEGTVSDLLSLARVGEDHISLRRERRPVAAAVEETVSLFRPRLDERHVRLDLEVPSTLQANLDWERVTHLLRNLLDNAVRYTPPGGTIRISGRQRAADVEIEVFNSGATVDAEDLPHLFVPFYRGRRSGEGGAGLGLALCAWVAHAHGGSITLQNVQGGVACTVRLPR